MGVWVGGLKDTGRAVGAALRLSGTRWVKPGWAYHGTNDSSLTAGRLYYIPIWVESPWTYVGIGINVTTAVASGLSRLGIYTFASGLPGALVLDAGTVDCGTTGRKTVTISQRLIRGYYFLAVVSDSAIVVTGFDAAVGGDPGLCPVSGFGTTVEAQKRQVILYATGRSADVAGGLAATAPAPSASHEFDYAVVDLQEA